MAAPYFRIQFKKYPKDLVIGWMYITSDFYLSFIRSSAPMAHGHWRYLATYIDRIRVGEANTALKPDGYWDNVLESAYHDQSLEGKL